MIKKPSLSWLHSGGITIVGHRPCWLQDTSYSLIDHGMICAFVERWHEETSNFHLPFGEMIVTLDDVTCLLHLPIDSMLLSHGSTSRDEVVEWGDVLGV